jgi:hypothetical protein
MNEITKRAARDAGVVAVEHRVETTYSDDRAPYTYAVSHNIAGTPTCRHCGEVRQNMEAFAFTPPCGAEHRGAFQVLPRRCSFELGHPGSHSWSARVDPERGFGRKTDGSHD